MALPLRVERATPCDRSEATLAFAPQPQPETQMDPKNPNQIVAGTVFVQLPPHLSLPEEAGTLSPDQMNRLPKARHGIGLACEQAATAMEKASITVPEVTPDELRRAGMAAEARRQGLDKDPEVLEAMKQAMIRKYLQEVGQQEVQPSAVPEAELRAYYDANVGLYHKPEQVDVSHMLFKTEAQARKVADELKAGAEGNAGKLVATWNDYVVRLSEDKSTAPYLGALGPVSRTVPPGASEAEVQRQQAVPQGVIEAAFAMKPFEVGPVVHSPQGWHVLMVTSRSPAVDKSFEDVKDSIRARVVKRERDLRRQQLIESLRTNAKVTVNDEALRLITIQPPEPTGKGKGLAHEATPEHGETEDLAP
jgi:hypothetical protein